MNQKWFIPFLIVRFQSRIFISIMLLTILFLAEMVYNILINKRKGSVLWI